MRYLTKFAISIFILIALNCGAQKKVIPAKIEFKTNFEAAKALAIETNRPMIIDFFTDWCKWCKTLDTLTYKDSLVIGLSLDNVFVKINAEVDTALARKYSISGYPTIVLTKSNGEEVDRIWGYMPPADFYNQIQLYMQGKETMADYLNRLQDEPENLEYLSIVVEKYAGKSQFAKAIEINNKIIQLDADNSQGYGFKAWGSLYDTYGRAKDFKNAIKTCQDIISKYPNTPISDDAAAMLAYYTAQDGDSKGALALYREYLEKYPQGGNIEMVKKRLADLEGNQ